MNLKFTCMAAAVSLAMLQMSGACAQQAPAASDGLQMERVVVTGTTGGSSKMKSSVSVSTMEHEAIMQAAPTSAADVLRSIPGVRSESSGGEGNANMTVRGLPNSAGGARYVQIQEDGLPVMQFGDVAFSTPDAFVRIDGALSRLEVVRGGSASTLGTNAPGGIINFITKTGEEKGGSIGLTKGLGYDSTRMDFDFGGAISDKTRFFIGGFYRSGEGVRNSGVNSEQGGQVRGNITHQLDNGFIRLSFKHLDDKTPTALPVSVLRNGQQISAIDGIDPRTVSFYSPYWVRDVSLDKNNNRVSSNVNDGMTVKSDTVGFEAQFKVGDGYTLSENFRKSANTGRFIGVFAANSGTIGNYTFATGPNTGKAYSGRAFSAVVFNTSIDDVGSAMSDTKLSKSFQVAGDNKVTATAGLYTSVQDIGLTWNFNQYLMQATGAKPALLNNATTSASGTPGLVGPAFGGCCSRAIDAQYRSTSPYLNVGLENGPLNIDASVRQDRQKASGTFNKATPAGTNSLRYDPATTKFIDYSLVHNSFSVGGNYKVTPALAFFARVSEGVAFNADRILFNDTNPVDGSVPISINTVKQIEGGVKWRSGALSTFVTVFQAKTKESNYEATTQTTTANSYDAKGVEVEAAYRIGDFRVNGGLTLTDAKIVATKDAGVAIGNSPKRQARAVYQFSPTYAFGDALFGVSVIGTGKSWADDAHTLVMPAYNVVNGFVNYQVSTSTALTLSANNLFNKIGYTEIENGGYAARSITGRAVKASVKYSF